MSRKSRRWWNRRHKRFERIISLLEQSNADPKRRNRKNRLRVVYRYARTEIARHDREEATDADQA
ncbi:MAG: hypothetical protein ACLP9L_05055 [Thermoguttaceae bacterium]